MPLEKVTQMWSVIVMTQTLGSRGVESCWIEKSIFVHKLQVHNISQSREIQLTEFEHVGGEELKLFGNCTRKNKYDEKKTCEERE